MTLSHSKNRIAKGIILIFVKINLSMTNFC